MIIIEISLLLLFNNNNNNDITGEIGRVTCPYVYVASLRTVLLVTRSNRLLYVVIGLG